MRHDGLALLFAGLAIAALVNLRGSLRDRRPAQAGLDVAIVVVAAVLAALFAGVWSL